ncbi:aminodeoxychorismate synthase, component I [candidate division GN15 bacterium]|nr:aminodeoxychorismate synthase, component I [candidate division GN15 bacterium]
MRMPQKKALSGLDRTEAVFSRLAGTGGSVWLDTSLGVPGRGTRSVMARAPRLKLAFDGQAVIKEAGGQRFVRPANIHSYLQELNNAWAEPGLVSVGYITYEAMIRMLSLEPAATNRHIPEAMFCFYDSAMLFVGASDEPLITGARADEYGDVLKGPLQELRPPSPPPDALGRATMSVDEYLRRVTRVKEHILEGDIYQANLTTRFDIDCPLDPWDVYRHLRRINPAPFSAFLDFGDFEIISCSPERMFLLNADGRIATAPIKGTVASGTTEAEHKRRVEELLKSVKDRAELLMIVDLLRNDLGRVARVGSVTVDSLFKAERYASVTHLVSDISARLQAGLSLSDVFTALSPGGSITGAPKRRAVEILLELETQPRDVYTGCIGWVYRGRAEFNIAIRTMIHDHDGYHVHAGGGIVADSDPEFERQEVLLKAERIFAALGVRPSQMGW